MKFAAFGVLDYEYNHFLTLKEKYNLDIDIFFEDITRIDHIDCSNYDGVSLITLNKVENHIWDRFTNLKVVATRSIGFNYLDIDYLTNRDIVVTNANYNPSNVSDFTIMVILMLLRKAKVSVCRSLVNDFSLDGLKGRELKNMTVGILGTGKIGKNVIKSLSGFGCNIICYDLYEQEEVKKYAKYVSFEELIKTADIISLHMPLTQSNYHIINKDTISMMKDGVILVNTARGGLIDIEALIDGVESLKIGAVSVDTVEGEENLSHFDLGTNVKGLKDKKNIMYLKQFANVLFTPHYAFFTDEAVFEMIDCSLRSLKALNEGKSSFENQVNLLNKR